jgi:two-component system response regulator RegA
VHGDKPILRLLVIGDDLTLHELVKDVAEPHGFEVAAPAASKIFKSTTRSWSPTLIVMDLKRPSSDGIEILYDLAVIKCTASIILVSSLDSRTLDSALRLGAERGLKMAGVIRKPVPRRELDDLLVRHKGAE